MSLWLKKIYVSSANRVGSDKRDAFGRSLTYTRNRSGPRIDPWGTTSNIFKICFAIFTYFNYCFLLDKQLSHHRKKVRNRKKGHKSNMSNVCSYMQEIPNTKVNDDQCLHAKNCFQALLYIICESVVKRRLTPSFYHVLAFAR